MKSLKLYIAKGLHVNRNTNENYHNYHPKTNNELQELVKKLIKERGNDGDLNDIDTSEIIDMKDLFVYSDFNGDISGWDTSNVENMSGTFAYSKFNGDISKWDVSNVKRTGLMFNNSPLEKNPPKWYK